MRFAEVATYLDRMEATRSRNELVKTLAELYAKTSPDEIQPVTYLIQGRLVPFFEPVEIGMGEKLVMASIAQASTRPSAEVSALFNTLGDLGLVAERLSTGAAAKTPSITEAHSRLMEIAASVGPGSVERKRTLFASLLSDLDARSAKHLVRMALGRLRLGIGDPTVLEALSFAKKGDRSLRPALEAAYNRTSDLGLIANRGRIVIIGNRGRTEIDARQAMGKDATILGMTLFNISDADIASINAYMMAGLENGTLKPVVGKEFPLADAARAQDAVMATGAHGKIVLVP